MTSEFVLPERKHLVHKPVELRNLSKKLQASVDIYSDEYVWQYKYDGCHMIVVVVAGKAYGFSRTGEVVLSCDHILREVEEMCVSSGLLNYVFFGEAWDKLQTHSKISGDLRRHSASELEYKVFDAVPLVDFISGHCGVQYSSRLALLEDVLYASDCLYTSPVRSFRPNDLAYQEKALRYVRTQCPFELDGFVAKRKDGLWTAGAGKGGEAIKVKNHVSLDLRCVGLGAGVGKFAGMVGSLTCEYKGGLINVSGGALTTEERLFFWTTRCKDRGGLIGSIVEVHALAASEHGDLREARFHRLRTDKTEPSE